MDYFCALQAFDLQSETVTTLRFCTSSNDIYIDNAQYTPRITQPALSSRAIFLDGKIGGGAAEQVGVMVLENSDGALDFIGGYSLVGRELRGYVRDSVGAVTEIHRYIIGGVDLGDTVTLQMRDRTDGLRKPLQQNTYSGGNAADSLTGVDGDKSLSGVKKPLAFGVVCHVEPRLVNHKLLIYQINDGAVFMVASVLLGGSYRVPGGADYADLADMYTNSPAAGEWRLLSTANGSYLRLGAAFSFPLAVTFLTHDPATTAAAAVDLARSVAMERGGLVSGDFVSADLINGRRFSPLVGLSDDGNLTVADALDRLTAAAGLFWFLDNFSRLRFVPFAVPGVDDAPVWSFYEWAIVDIKPAPLVIGGVEAPPWSVKMYYDNNNRPISGTEITGVASTDRKNWLENARRSAAADDATVKTKHLLAQSLEYESVLIARQDAEERGAAVLALLNSGAGLFDVKIGIDASRFPDNVGAMLAAVDLGAVVLVEFPRYGLSAGKKCAVVSIAPDYQAQTLLLRVFG